eukprot:m.256674 g.256674  ORF g.256674 m.256674 type:complete len:1715 (+) comp26744_c0_seq8:78-5222(+)
MWFLHFRLLLWKNYTLQKRRPISTIFEIGLPTLFIVILVGVRQIVNDTNEPATFYEHFSPSWDMMPSCNDSFLLAYAPNSPAINNIMQQAASNLSSESTTFYPEGFKTEDDLLQALGGNGTVVNGGCHAGVVFKTFDPATHKYDISIRMDATPGGYDSPDGDNANSWLTELSFPLFTGAGPRDDSDLGPDFGGLPGYAEFGFTEIQFAVASVLIAEAVDSADASLARELMDKVQLQRLVYPPYRRDGFLYAIQFGLPLLLMLALLYTALSIVKSIVWEKERRLKESMKMMGLNNSIQWAAWFAQYFCFLMITMIIITILMTAGKVLKNSDMSVIFVFLMLFALATVAFCFLLSTFFSKASTGAAAAGIIWFLSYVPYFFIAQNYQTMSFSQKQVSCLLSTTGMALGANLIAFYEARGDGVQWDNIGKAASVDDDFSFGAVMGMLIFDIILYMALAWYIEGVFPGDFGIPQKWYFPCLPSYWCGTSGKRSSEEEPLLSPLISEDVDEASRDKFETDPSDLVAGVEIRKLRKEFGTKVAVKGTSLNMYEGQITALLGHNGAGKTTTMSMLTGLYPPTSGTAYIAGCDITTDISGAQNVMGLCPQHDVLWDSLTVAEHLWFFCRMKGISNSDARVHIDQMLRDLELEDKRKAPTKTLSGGMKRKLSCGIALIGGSKVVILDEPTSGMDPSARRAAWDLLYKYKEGRTMILSTHFMDEADLLGDRIAIMSDGVVQCCGSSLFLKSKYGVGYNMVIVKEPDCDVDAISQLIHTYVPDAAMKGNVGAELTFVLPRASSDRFTEMFSELESGRNKYRYSSFGVSVTTMEEVFLNVGERQISGEKIDIQTRIDNRNVNSDNQGESSTDDEDSRLLMPSVSADSLVTGTALKIQQFKTMIRKRYYHSMRNKSAILSQLLLPLFFTLIALVLAKTVPAPADSPSRSLSTLASHYGANTVWYTTHSQSDSAPNTVSSRLGDALKDVLDGISGQTVEAIPDTPSWNQSQYYFLQTIGSTPSQIADFNKQNLLVLDFSPDNETSVNPTAFFNGQAYHSIAETLALYADTVLKMFETTSSLSFANYPLPRTDAEKARDQQQQSLGFTISFNILFGMAFLASSFVLFLVAERRSKAKHIQFVSGVDIVSYWSSSYLWDMANFLVPTIGCIILFVAFSVDNYSGDRLGLVFLLFVTYGYAIIPLMYLASFLFENTSVAYTRLTMFNIVTGLAALLTISILEGVASANTTSTAKTAFLFLPNYCFGQGLSDIYNNYAYLKLVKKVCPASELATCCKELDKILQLDAKCNPDYLGWDEPGICKYVMCMVIEGTVYFILVLLVEWRVLSRLANLFIPNMSPHVGTIGHEDQDVAAERDRVQELLCHRSSQRQNGPGAPQELVDQEDILLFQDLTKIYGNPCSKQKLAVNGLTLGIPEGECFGLLGVNGAGKTTTFKMITGDESITAGTAFIDGYDTAVDTERVRQRMGYCPQFDALIDLMTGRELLTMYANLRGVPEPDISVVVQDLIIGLMLEKHADKFCGTYSGGNKRKLSVAMAMIGNPPLILLDEPTSGMDPGARRFLWDALIRAMAGGRCIVLTSHSMEECEALCTRLAIMVNGQFQCLGSPQHLKTRFGDGFGIQCKVEEEFRDEVEKVKQFIEERFPAARLKEAHQGMVHYEVPGGELKWSELFATMEQAKTDLHLADYSVSQTTLEQVFLEFARHQHDDPLQQGR